MICFAVVRGRFLHGRPFRLPSVHRLGDLALNWIGEAARAAVGPYLSTGPAADLH
jgi:hypothetical protein